MQKEADIYADRIGSEIMEANIANFSNDELYHVKGIIPFKVAKRMCKKGNFADIR